MKSQSLRVCVLPLLLAFCATLAGLCPPALGQDADLQDLRDQARQAYDQGRCEQVLSAYNRVGQLDGSLIEGVDSYRIGFCLAYLRQGDATEYYETAASSLTAETDHQGAPLEAYFYQVNALLNLRRAPEAAKAAALAVERWEAGALVIPEADPESWFRLGKLFRDAGDIHGAMVPFGRALDAAEAGGKLRDPYLERIARGAAQAENAKLARRASVLLAKGSKGDIASELKVARALLAAGDIEQARESFKRAGKGRGEAGLTGQYAVRLLDRIEELEAQGMTLLTTLGSGESIAELSPTKLQTALTDAARSAWGAMKGRMVEVPRRKKPGTIGMPHPETARQMLEAQQQFVSLAHAAMLRGYPLREWSVGGGYTSLIYHRWTKVYRQSRREQRREQLIEVLAE